MRCSGTGAPPVMNTRMPERSAAPAWRPGERLEQIRVPESDGDVPALDQAEDLVGIARLGDHDGAAFEQHRQHVDAGPTRAEEGRDPRPSRHRRGNSATDNRLTTFQVMLPCVSITPSASPWCRRCEGACRDHRTRQRRRTGRRGRGDQLLVVDVGGGDPRRRRRETARLEEVVHRLPSAPPRRPWARTLGAGRRSPRRRDGDSPAPAPRPASR